MKQNNFREIRDSNGETKPKRFENDYDYPWDENYTTGLFNIEGIKHSLDINEIITASKKY